MSLLISRNLWIFLFKGAVPKHMSESIEKSKDFFRFELLDIPVVVGASASILKTKSLSNKGN